MQVDKEVLRHLQYTQEKCAPKDEKFLCNINIANKTSNHLNTDIYAHNVLDGAWLFCY